VPPHNSRSSAERSFVVFSGLPGSGKSWLAWKLAPLVGLEVIDKDDVLERLFESRGIGDIHWRRRLSRESDEIFQREAEASQGALLVSFWHLPGMSPESGTPTSWLRSLSNRIVNVHCVCSPEIAAKRYSERSRHPGHLDRQKPYDEILGGLRKISRLPPPELGRRIEVDTSSEVNVNCLAPVVVECLDNDP
jgi:hypothetical protein